jgi:hypothetical protein
VNLEVILGELQAHGVESIFRLKGVRKKGRLTIETVEDGSSDKLAEVQFNPRFTLRVQQGVWIRFKEGRSKEREIIAHEIGHVFLHDDDAKPFSRDGTSQIRFADQEYSAEWQAHRFADHLLIPTALAQEIDDADHIAFVCNVTEEFATERLAAVRAIKKPINSFSKQPCPDCGSNTIISYPLGDKCDWCGYQQD